MKWFCVSGRVYWPDLEFASSVLGMTKAPGFRSLPIQAMSGQAAMDLVLLGLETLYYLILAERAGDELVRCLGGDIEATDELETAPRPWEPSNWTVREVTDEWAKQRLAADAAYEAA